MDKNTVSIVAIEDMLRQAGGLMHWFHDQKQLNDWGGPSLRFPLCIKQLKGLHGEEGQHSYYLTNGQGLFLGFGQFYLRLGRHHLARVVVSPAARGQGLGRRLITMLMQAACQTQQGSGFSLFVDPGNLNAIQLYQSLGFESCPYPDPKQRKLACYDYMVKPDKCVC